ncbi:MAG TPA: nucleotide exchange factor GrpE [Acidimicrobiia bacterium]|nr:nucleotide exchange factor GrpE [Acidimicrobiia bacterium]
MQEEDRTTDARAADETTGVEGGGHAAPPVLSPETLRMDLPDDPDEAIQMLLTDLHDARAEADKYLDDLRRVAADFDNYRKRALRDQQHIVDRAAERVLSAMLPVLDSFDAALTIEATTDTEAKLLRGMRSTHAQLMDVLGKEGLEPITAIGEPFDPEVHEAVMTTGGDGRLVVAQELRRGYTLRGRVLRAALVALEEGS